MTLGYLRENLSKVNVGTFGNTNDCDQLNAYTDGDSVSSV